VGILKKMLRVLLAVSMIFFADASHARAGVDIHEVDIGSSGSAIIGKSWNWLVFTKKQDKHESLFMFDTNKPDSEPIDMNQKLEYVWGPQSYIISNGYDMILFDQWDVALLSYNALERKTNWKTKILNPGQNFMHFDWTKPTLKDGMLYLRFGSEIMVIDVKTGAIEKPCSQKVLSSTQSIGKYSNVIHDKYIFSYDDSFVYCYDLNTKKQIWNLMFNNADSPFLIYYFTDSTFFWKGKLYVQYINVYGCTGKLNQLARVDPETGKIEEKKQSIAALAGWSDGNGTAYIFQASQSCGDKYIEKVNLDEMSMQLLPAKDINIPLGLASGKLVYTTKDSVLICDTSGNIVETVKFGEITTENCRLYDNTVYYISGSKLKWFDIPASN
jgi:hypothetical protein